MRSTTFLAFLLAVTLMPALATAQSTPPATPTLPPVTLYGRAELSPGVPCAGCRVVVEGAPLAATVDAVGMWTINGIPPGRWEANLTNPNATNLGSYRFTCGGQSGDVTNCGTSVLARAGGISGRILFNTTSEYDLAVVGVPDLGVYTQLNCGGGYLLTDVAPGWRKLVVSTPSQSKELWVFVNPAKVTMNMNLVFASVATPPGT